jgi:hypothetical protein
VPLVITINPPKIGPENHQQASISATVVLRNDVGTEVEIPELCQFIMVNGAEGPDPSPEVTKHLVVYALREIAKDYERMADTVIEGEDEDEAAGV